MDTRKAPSDRPASDPAILRLGLHYYHLRTYIGISCPSVAITRLHARPCSSHGKLVSSQHPLFYYSPTLSCPFRRRPSHHHVDSRALWRLLYSYISNGRGQSEHEYSLLLSEHTHSLSHRISTTTAITLVVQEHRPFYAATLGRSHFGLFPLTFSFALKQRPALPRHTISWLLRHGLAACRSCTHFPNSCVSAATADCSLL